VNDFSTERNGASEERMETTTLSYTERKQRELLEQRRLELAAKAAGITYLMYMPRSFPHPSGLLYRSEPNARTSIWNPLQNDGDLFRLALAVPDVNLHEIITRECRAGGDVAGCVREAFVQAVTGPIRLENLARPSAPLHDESAGHGAAAENGAPERPTC
jgi:hypothetical protein